MALKRISSLIVGTSKDLAQTERKFPSRALVMNQHTGEIRKGPGKWSEMQPATTAAEADLEVDVCATGNVTIATALNDGDVMDGVTLEDGMVVLLPYQSTAHQVGIYVVGDTPARHEDFDTYAAHAGTVVKVKTGGTANAGKTFLCTSTKTGTLGTTALKFEQLQNNLQIQLMHSTGNAAAATATQKYIAVDDDGNLALVTGAMIKTFATS